MHLYCWLRITFSLEGLDASSATASHLVAYAVWRADVIELPAEVIYELGHGKRTAGTKY